MEEHFNFMPLLLVLLLAFGVPIVLARLRWLPIVVGEILAGVVIGHSGLGLVDESEMLAIFSNIGLAFLMFLAGLEIDFNRLFPTRRIPDDEDPSKQSQESNPNFLKFALLTYGLTLLLALPGGYLLNMFGLQGNPWLLAFTLSATSLGVLLPIIKQRGLTHTQTGQAVFLTALLADFVTVILLTIFLIIQNKGFDVEIFSVGLLFLAFFIVYHFLGRFFRLERVRSLIDELSQVTVQIKVRGAIAILMAFVVFATLLGLELILGAFLAGMIISLIKAPEDIDLIHKLEAFGYGFFIPVFFILVGVNLELSSLLENPRNLLILPVLLIISLVVKVVPTLTFRKFLPWRETIASGFLLNTHLSIEIAIAVIGVQLELLSSAAGTGLVLFSIITVLLMPILFTTVMPSPTIKAKRWMAVYGAEQLGLQVAKILEDHGEPVKILDRDPTLIEAARQAGFTTVFAETIGECLEEVTKDQVEALIVLTSSDTLNLDVCRGASCQGIDHVVALVNDPSRIPEFRGIDVNPFAPALYRPALLALMTRSPDIFRLLTSPTEDQDVREICMKNQRLDGFRLRDLDFPGNVLVLAISRENEILIPHGKIRVQVNDRLTLLGSLDKVIEVAQWLETGD